MFKSLGNIASLMKTAQEMGGKMQALSEHLKRQRASGAAGGGMVEVEVNGLGELLRVKIDASLVERGEREMIEDLIPAAVNQAQTKARQLHAEAMKDMASDFNVPGLTDTLEQLTGGKDRPED